MVLNENGNSLVSNVQIKPFTEDDIDVSLDYVVFGSELHFDFLKIILHKFELINQNAGSFVGEIWILLNRILDLNLSRMIPDLSKYYISDVKENEV